MPGRGEDIYERKDGRREGRRIVAHAAKGRAQYRPFYANSYNGVKSKLREFSAENPKRIRKGKGICIAEYASMWLYAVKIRCKVSTYNKYCGIFKNYILPVIGEYKPRTVSLYQMEEIFLSIAHLASKTQNDILCIIKRFFSYLEAGGCPVAVNLKGFHVRQEFRRMRVFSVEEQRQLSRYLLEETDLSRLGAYLCLYTGIRIGELCALKRKNLSFDNRSILVEKTMQRIQTEGGRAKTEVILTEPKSKCSIREIPLPDFLLPLCRQYYEELEPEAFLLSGRADKFVEPRTLQNRFRQYLKESGIDKANFHTLRHTFATRCVEQGFDIKTLSELLGHANVNITLNRYVHSSMELKRNHMEKLREIL